MQFHKNYANSEKKKAWVFFGKEKIPKTVIDPYTEMYGEPEKLNFKKFCGRPVTVAMPKVKSREKTVSVYVIKDTCSTSEHVSIPFIPN